MSGSAASSSTLVAPHQLVDRLHEEFAPNRHIHFVEGILQQAIRVNHIDLFQCGVHIGCVGLGRNDKLDPRPRLEAFELEPIR